MPKSESAINYFKRYSKFYLQGLSEGDENICWRVEAKDSISMPGILEINATEYYANPSAVYGFASEAEQAVDKARGIIADTIGANKEEIYFTGGGSESDNWALKATAEAYGSKGKHIITTNIEHPAVKNTLGFLESLDFKVTYLPVNENGIISIEELKEAITPETILITVMHANNELGTIQPIEGLDE